MIGRGGERGSGISVLMARLDDDDITVYGLFEFNWNTGYHINGAKNLSRNNCKKKK